MAGRLYNGLVELVAVVGMDEDTGLKPATYQPPSQTSSDTDSEGSDGGLYSRALEPHVVAAVSGHVALYPFRDPRQDPHYPPRPRGPPVMGLKKRGTSQPTRNPSSASPRNLSVDTVPGTPGVKRRISRRVSFAAMARKPSVMVEADGGGTGTGTAPTELPVSNEVLNSLGPFCYPDHAYAYRYKVEDQAHFLVFTDISGVRSYASCLTFYRPFIVIKDNFEMRDCDPDSDNWWAARLWGKPDVPDLEEGQQLAYLPTCLVLVSRHPYFTTMKDCLSRLVQVIERSPEDMDTHLKDFALQLTMTPCPPAGQLAVKFTLDQVVFMLLPPSAPLRPVVDLPLNLIFECFPVSTVVRLVGAILLQHKILFVSSSYALLTVITESLLTFIAPFHWRLPYVPILSEQLLEFVDAPGTFLMGCHSTHKHQIRGVEGLIVADINTGELSVCPTLSVPPLPPGPVAVLEAAYQRLQCHFDIYSLERRSPFQYEDMRATRQDYQRQFNHDITQAFLGLMVSLFRDVIPCLKIERRFFHSDRFMECLTEAEKPFYQKELQTDMFHQFLKDRFARKSDYWSEMEEKTRPIGRNSLDLDRNTPTPRMSRTGSLLSNSLFLMSPSQEWRPLLAAPVTLPSLTYLQLPAFIPELHNYTYDKGVMAVTEQLEECRTPGLRAALLYLRGMLKAANGQAVSALQDLHDLCSADSRLFPTQAVTEIIRGLSDSARDALYATAFYQRSDQIQSLCDQKLNNAAPEQRIIMDFDKIPRKLVDRQEFGELVEMLEIVADHDTITRLFEALTLSKSRTLDPETFEVFYECWKETELALHELLLPDLLLTPSECFLKASSLIKTSSGTGRIALTQKRLIFLREGSDKHRDIVKLRDIKNIEKVTMTSFLNQVPALRIIPKGPKSSTFVAWLKDARDGWYLMLYEIWSGKLIADEMRDPAIIQQAAHNVLLLDAVLQSGQEPCSAHSGQRDKAAAHLCYFTRRRERGMDKLPPETRDVLQHRVDPNMGQAERRAVEALLYTAGNCSGPEEDQRPRLWCGMANGKLQVFDASTWLLEPQHFKAKDRIVCLVAVGDSEVWAGSFDSSIYVIDIKTKTCKQALFEHTDMVCGMTVVQEKRQVFSASLSGEVLGWDMDTLQLTSRVTLPNVKSLRAIEHHHNQLWCCCGCELVTVTLEGAVVSRAMYMEGETSHQIDCFLITQHEEVWLGCGRRGEVAVLDINTLAVSLVLKIPCRGVSKMVGVQDKVWVGSKGGKIYIYDSRTHKQEKVLKAHTDAIRSLCSAQERYVMSGAGSHDGKVAIWRTSAAE